LIPPDFIDEVLSRTDIVEIIDGRVKLKKTGQNYSGLCPFHTEKSPSFSVNGDKQFYYCFGCQASGSALKFLMEFDRMDFISAVEHLAGRVGLEVPREAQSAEASEQQQKRKSIYEVLEQACAYLRQQLKEHTDRDLAVSYLKNRGLSGEIARDYGLGYAPPGWDNLLNHIGKTNHERQLLIDSGMVIDKPDENKTYDRFRERIMFPIRDLRGRVIAFGGRIIGDGKPKYLNSPETPVFHKSRELYGLYEARRHNKKLEQLLVVEGYMDVVALAQHEIHFAVATLGTATTSEHLERLFRMVSRVVFCFDGDNAGRNAAWKALQVALPHLRDGRSARFLFVPDGEDPDSLVRSEGKDKFMKRLEEAQPLSDFFFDKLKQEVDINSLDGKAALSQMAMPMIHKVPKGVFRELMVGELSTITNLTSERLLSLSVPEPIPEAEPVMTASRVSPEDTDFAGYADIDLGEDQDDMDDYHGYLDVPQAAPKLSKLAEKALEIALIQPEVSASLPAEVLDVMKNDAAARLLADVLALVHDEDVRSPVMLLARFQGSADFEQLREIAEREQLLSPGDLEEEFLGIIKKLTEHRHRESQAEIRGRLLAKPFSELTAEEKDQLRSLSRR
jgi:DNA primase